MKNLTKLMLLVPAYLMISSCVTNTKTPAEVVKTMIVATQKLDYATMKKHLASERIARLEEREKEMNENPYDAADFILQIKDAKVEIVSEDISEDENSATVTIKVSQLKKADGSFEKDIKLIKENGEWKFDATPL
ncbi:MAG: DUF4878 domain-containing protein [Prevotellaceae bacterium]|jgi:hypothetical protein|nr:DUF4878 domain-containing protein [Prevotellaceae bacterium]